MWRLLAGGLLSVLGGCSTMAFDSAFPEDDWGDFFDAGVQDDAGEPWSDDDYSDGDASECVEDAGPECFGPREPFECPEGKLVEAPYVCDGFWDCDLGEDETVGCLDVPDDIYVCANGDHIPASYECDAYADCETGEDETVCDGGFICTSGWDLPDAWLCDTVPDCPDGEDEVGCEEQLDGGTGDAGVDGGVDGGYVEITLPDGYEPAR